MVTLNALTGPAAWVGVILAFVVGFLADKSLPAA